MWKKPKDIQRLFTAGGERELGFSGSGSEQGYGPRVKEILRI